MMTWISIWLAVLLITHGCLMLVDEFYFHRKRGLGNWEAWGHPFDSAVFAIAVSLPAFQSFSMEALWGYSSLAILSSVVITKDEWVHHAECLPGEQWVHSMLFVLHGFILAMLGLHWAMGGAPLLASMLFWGALGFGLYQALYWRVRNVRVQRRIASEDQQRVLR